MPAEDTLLISARVKPSEIASSTPGRTPRSGSASRFIDLRDARRQGPAGARMRSRTSARTSIISRYSLKRIENYLGAPEERLTISPGMATPTPASTPASGPLMEYMLKPIVKPSTKAARTMNTHPRPMAFPAAPLCPRRAGEPRPASRRGAAARGSAPGAGGAPDDAPRVLLLGGRRSSQPGALRLLPDARVTWLNADSRDEQLGASIDRNTRRPKRC